MSYFRLDGAVLLLSNMVQPEWLTPSDVAVPQAAEMEYLLARLAPVHPRIPPGIERVSKLWAYIDPLSLFQLLMISSLLAPATAWHMMHAKSDTMGMTHWVVLFLDWLRAETIDPLQGIATLTIMYLADAMMEQ